MKIRTKLTAVIGLAAIILIFFAMVVSVSMMQRNLISTVDSKNAQVAQYVGNAVNLYVLERNTGVETVAKRAETVQAIRSNDSEKMKAVMAELTGINQRVDVIATIGIHNNDCTVLAVDSLTPQSLVGASYRNRDYCAGVTSTKQRYISSAYTSSVTNSTVLSVAYPIADKDGMVGYTLTVFDMDKLGAYMQSAQVGNNRLILLDRNGNEFMDTGGDVQKIGAVRQPISKEVNDLLESWQYTGNIEVTDNKGVEYLAQFQKFDYFTVIVAEKRADALGIMDNIVLFDSIIGVGSMLISVLLCWLIVTAVVAKRLERITDVITKISKGDMSVSIGEDLKASDDEIGEMARAFDRTIASLKLAMLESGEEKKKK